MRQKMRQSAVSKFGSESSARDHIKQGEGGLIDIEFITQFGALSFARECPDLSRWSDNIRLLEVLQQSQCFDPDDMGFLQDAFRELRMALHRKSLAGEGYCPNLNDFPQTWARVTDIWQKIYVMGVFEGVRAYETDKGPAIFKLQEHTDRLFRSAHIMRMNMPYSKDEINEAHKKVIRQNNLHEAYMRPMAFYGSEGMGLRAANLKTHVIVAAWPWPFYMSPEAKEKGIKIRTSSYTRHHVNISMCKAKANGHYINSMLALNEALESGCEEALLQRAVAKSYS